MATISRAVLAAVCGLSWAGAALAGYVGESFLQVADIAGGWPGENYKNWVKFEAREWIETSGCAARQNKSDPWVCDERPFAAGENRRFFSGPWAPRRGPGKLAVAVSKRSPALRRLMDLCLRKTRIAELTYAESSEMSRLLGEQGSRPASVPEFFEYRLIDVQLSCPVVAAAPEQALVLSFNDIAWLNFKGEVKVAVSTPAPAKLPPRPSSGESRTFLITWMSQGAAYSAHECAQLNREPTADDYFALWPKAAAAKGSMELARKGGLATLGAQISFRGPEGLNVCALPGIVGDPGHAAPESDVARGFDLDGYDGNGERPPNTHRHRNYVAEDGRTGIDNQLYSVTACVPGFRPDGNLTNIRNQLMRNGLTTVLLEVSGIDDAQNDPSVAVTVVYSRDRMVKTADGSQVLPNYTFRISDDPELTPFFTRLQGRIENGIVVTDPVDEVAFVEGGPKRLFDAQMRIEFLPNGNVKAVLGGYQDWRPLMTNWGRNRILEPTMRYQCPGIYNALKRAADGLRDPLTGEFKGISVAYDIQGVRAFIPPRQLAAL